LEDELEDDEETDEEVMEWNPIKYHKWLKDKYYLS
jgi:hypothetical protein